MSSSIIMTNAERTGEHPVVPAASKPSPTARDEVAVDVDTTAADAAVQTLVARVAELEAQTELSVEWAVVFSAGDIHDYQSEHNARSVHRSLELPPENLLCRHVRRGPWTAVTA